MHIEPTTAKELVKEMTMELDYSTRMIREKRHYIVLPEHEKHDGGTRFAERTIFLDNDIDVDTGLSK